jgi:hypothetical protein
VIEVTVVIVQSNSHECQVTVIIVRSVTIIVLVSNEDADRQTLWSLYNSNDAKRVTVMVLVK